MLYRQLSSIKPRACILLLMHFPGYARFECPDGNSTFSIHQVDELVKRLKDKDVIFTSDPKDKMWLWREAHLYDLDGNHLYFTKLVIIEKNTMANTIHMKKIQYILIAILLVSCNFSEEKKEKISAKPSIEKQFPKLESNRYNVAFLIMEGVYNTELTAPFDIFQHTIFRDSIKAMNVFTIANTDKAITTFEGMRIIPDYNYLKDALPKIDILVVPSAEHHLDTDLEDKAMIEFDNEAKVDNEGEICCLTL